MEIPKALGSSWKFVEELKKPLHGKIRWDRLNRGSGEASLKEGVRIDFRFPDEKGLLETARDDFKSFLRAGGISLRGSYGIVVEQKNTGPFESFEVEAGPGSCALRAGDAEGIRRGLVFIEDEILRTGGPFIRKGIVRRKPFIKTRISRCFFGPIKRPPMNRDELSDDVDYYPDEYLNRLAHEGVNGLWLTVQFSDLCRTRFFPSHGKDAEKRFERLARKVEKCARYGIKIYVFCIEPRGFGPVPEFLLPEEELEKHEYFRGHSENGWTYFCTSSPEGLEYIRECVHQIFSAVPGLGGLMDINLGERPTHCYSSTPSFLDNNCPRCSRRDPSEVLRDTTSALASGMHGASPGAEMISWLYVPSIRGENEAEIREKEKVITRMAARTPGSVMLQYNFESNGKTLQLGKERLLLDYWLAWAGPSDVFEKCARAARESGSRVSAKIQVGCSHELATVPFIPVPGNLHKIYSGMRRLKVSAAMQCWYFGNYPGLMNKAAGELSFEPFNTSRKDFTMSLAERDWGRDAQKATEAWEHFRSGYSSIPYNLGFTWYGPLHSSAAWPLYLEPADLPIAPSWKFGFPGESGDRIGECICYDHTLDEALVLLGRMKKSWGKGTRLFEEIGLRRELSRERKLDIGLAKALEIQISSAHNVFMFYSLREKLPFSARHEAGKSLRRMKEIAGSEIKNSLCLAELCAFDSRLGFHSEAEGYKYHPEKLKWRAGLLGRLLKEDFPRVEGRLMRGEPLFPAYTGEKPDGNIYRCGADGWAELTDRATIWRASLEKRTLKFRVECRGGKAEEIKLKIEPRRLWPPQTFSLSRDGKKNHQNFKPSGDQRWEGRFSGGRKNRVADFSIPLEIFDGYYREGGPIRVNVIRGDASWVPLNPLEPRLRYGTDNPADLGWLFP